MNRPQLSYEDDEAPRADFEELVRSYLRTARFHAERMNRRLASQRDPAVRELLYDVLVHYGAGIQILQRVLEESVTASLPHPVEPGEVEFVAMIDPGGTFTYVSCTAKVLGYTPQDLVESDFFGYLHSEDVEQVYQQFASASSRPGLPFSITFRFRSGDSAWVWLDASAQNLSDGSDVDGFIMRCRVSQPMGSAGRLGGNVLPG